MATIKISDQSFQRDVLDSSLPILVDYWADWCGPCKVIAPALEELSNEMAGQVTIAKLNIDENPETPTKYGVRGIPTLMLFKDGKIADTSVGSMSKTQLQKWLSTRV